MGNNRFHHLDQCPICGNYQEGMTVGSFLECRVCGLLSKKEVDFDEIDTQYKAGWESPSAHIQQTGATDMELSESYIAHLLKELRIKSFQGLRILDFGAGRGSMAEALLHAGAEVVCIEPYGMEELESKGFTVFRSIVDLPEDLLFDGIVCLDVIEHLFNPWEDFNHLRDFLAPNGWIFVSTPNSASLNSKLSGENWRERKNPGHIFLFNPNNLSQTLEIAGYSGIRRLKWNIVYHRNLLIQIKDFVLLQSGLDGELRFLAYKRK